MALTQTDLQAIRSVIKEELAPVDNRLNGVEEGVANLDKKTSTIESEVTETAVELRQLDKKLGSVETGVAGLDKKIIKLEANQANTDKTINEISVTLDGAGRTLISLEKSVNTNTKHLKFIREALYATIEHFESEDSQLKRRVDRVETSLKLPPFTS